MQKAKPLTKAEAKWLDDLEKLLLACPSDRIGFLTIGDPSLVAVDNRMVKQFDLEVHDGESEKNGVVLRDIIKSRCDFIAITG